MVSTAEIIAMWQQGEILEAIAAPYTSLMGEFFYAVFFMLIVFATWMRTNNIATVSISVLFLGSIFLSRYLFPPPMYQILTWTVVLMMAGVFYWLYQGRKNY